MDRAQPRLAAFDKPLSLLIARHNDYELPAFTENSPLLPLPADAPRGAEASIPRLSTSEVADLQSDAHGNYRFASPMNGKPDVAD